MREKLKIVIVGHVDHGKSTLIGRLLYDTNSLPKERVEEIKKVAEKLGKQLEFAHVMDHLQEEREQSVTIDTAQIFFKTKKRDYVIIDAPGHKEFIKNMITGASQAEAAILIVDVKEGAQEQTKRHAFILSLLGLNQIILAVNKMDLVNYEQEKFSRVKDVLLNFLAKIGVRASYIIPISAKNGENVAKRSNKMLWYSGPTILEALDLFKTKKEVGFKEFRFSVQDVYEIGGKEVIVGRMESGEVSVGEQIFLANSNQKLIVKTIEKFGAQPKKAVMGECVGLTLSQKGLIKRGSILYTGKQPIFTNTFKANLFWMASFPLKKNDVLLLRCATQEIYARIKQIFRRIDSSTLKILEENAEKIYENEVGGVMISCKEPVVVENFNLVPGLGRFVLEKDEEIVAGGIVCE